MKNINQQLSLKIFNVKLRSYTMKSPTVHFIHISKRYIILKYNIYLVGRDQSVVIFIKKFKCFSQFFLSISLLQRQGKGKFKVFLTSIYGPTHSCL